MNEHDLVIVTGKSRRGVDYYHDIGEIKSLDNSRQGFTMTIQMKSNGNEEEFSPSALTFPTRAVMRRLSVEEIERNCYMKEDKRRALGTIAVKDIDLFLANIAAEMERRNIRYHNYIQRVGLHHSHRFEFGTCEETIEIRNLSKANLGAIGIFFEYPNTDERSGPFSMVKDESRYIVWIYHTIKGKALTIFRKFLLNSILFYE
ncbi:hypothetical protein [Paenibacillus sp. Y412MC10]|uniref:hypothetical protein n=1 Tax=Geobacillus sp. (strain Y412MC10) TaxID=481743 RepID=UPI0011AB7FD3|nr:hypothetical protein [Paenibacillus sp. Y412MC10]